MSLPGVARKIFAYLWASPNTLLGLLAGLVVLLLGGTLRVVQGVLEFCVAQPGAGTNSLSRVFPFRAITFGHVILGASASELETARQHEHVHVIQYESWGPLFLPAYAASSLWQLVRGRRAYRDNFFERRAFAAESEAGTAAWHQVVVDEN
jgi:hypothetical protein